MSKQVRDAVSIDAEELDTAAKLLQTLPPKKIVEWTLEHFGDDVAVAASFQDVVMIDIALRVKPDIEVIFLDTEAHFKETLDFVAEMKERLSINLSVTHPGPEADASPCGSENCCQLRKVVPLKKALFGKRAWITSLKRVDATTRANLPVVEWDEVFGLVKVNPLAMWSDDDVAAYLRDHDLAPHPLIAKGYLSIGCAPTTRPVVAGEDPRSGRWAGMDKTECGLHPEKE